MPSTGMCDNAGEQRQRGTPHNAPCAERLASLFRPYLSTCWAIRERVRSPNGYFRPRMTDSASSIIDGRGYAATSTLPHAEWIDYILITCRLFCLYLIIYWIMHLDIMYIPTDMRAETENAVALLHKRVWPACVDQIFTVLFLNSVGDHRSYFD